ncbi:hypothetical protein VZT92_023014 [Zoarces viviparus]|uniref:Uncharacterized protein n=1 Tax=Zoarces viviparus TaxID=48416 RepID=A0AAW1E671_ZOAVI
MSACVPAAGSATSPVRSPTPLRGLPRRCSRRGSPYLPPGDIHLKFPDIPQEDTDDTCSPPSSPASPLGALDLDDGGSGAPQFCLSPSTSRSGAPQQ